MFCFLLATSSFRSSALSTSVVVYAPTLAALMLTWPVRYVDSDAPFTPVTAVMSTLKAESLFSSVPLTFTPCMAESALLPCAAVAKSDALLPESVRLPLASSPAKLPEVALLTLSAFPVLTVLARSLTAFDVAAVVSEAEFVADDSWTTPFWEVLASCMFFFSTVILPALDWVTLVTAARVSPEAATSATDMSEATTVPPVVVTRPRSAVVPTLPSLVMFPWVWDDGVISVGKSLTWDLVISMSWKVAAILPSVSVSVARVFPCPNPVMSDTSSVPRAAATAVPFTGLVPDAE